MAYSLHLGTKGVHLAHASRRAVKDLALLRGGQAAVQGQHQRWPQRITLGQHAVQLLYLVPACHKYQNCSCALPPAAQQAAELP